MDALDEDVFNILLATDIHLGYAEKDAIRGEDSFNTFEEILKTAAEREVDFILLGGDLFHDNKPSMACIHKAMSLIKKYCLGDRPVSVNFLSDQSENFKHCVNPVVNYEDPNLNISIPIFSIHGNHDDPSGFGRTCTLDLLSASGLVNYFGRVDDLSTIKISPLLMKKGASQLAIYGLSYIKDDRLTRLFREKKVHMYSQNACYDDWFNIFVCHQNRADRGPGKSLSEYVLPTFLDLIFWGHEHDCRVKEENNATRGFFVTQPGSSVATSLSEGESIPKHIAVLKVYQKNFKLEPIKLQTVRPFVFDSIILSNCELPDDGDSPKDNVISYVSEHIETMFGKVNALLTGHPKQATLPLIRLRVDYLQEEQMFNAIRFSQSLSDRVANPTDVILLKKEPCARKIKEGDVVDQDALDAAIDMEGPQSIWDMQIERIVETYFERAENEKHKLQVLSVRGMSEAVMQFINKDDKEAVEDVVKNQKSKTVKYLLDHEVNEDNGVELIQQFRELRSVKPEDEVKEAREVLAANRTAPRKYQNDDIIVMDSDDDEMNQPTTARGRGRGRGHGARTTHPDVMTVDRDDDYAGNGPTTTRGRGRGRGRGARTANHVVDDSDDRGRGGARARGRPASRRGSGRGASNAQLTLEQSFQGTRPWTSRQPSSTFKGISFSDSDSD